MSELIAKEGETIMIHLENRGSWICVPGPASARVSSEIESPVLLVYSGGRTLSLIRSWAYAEVQKARAEG